MLVTSYDDAKAKQLRHEGNDKGVSGGATLTPFFGSHYTPDHGARVPIEGGGSRDLPDAIFSQFDPGKVSRSHFHLNDQFQVIMGGKGTLGRHSLTPYSVHFSRAYTPYGPLLADSLSGLVLFVLRAHPDPGSQRLPQKIDQLMRVPDRQPWQVTRRVTFPSFNPGEAATGTMLLPVPDIKDEQGLAAYTLIMKPGAKVYAPDPSHGEGQYLIVTKGSVLHNDKEHKSLALVFVYPDEGPFQLHAGSQGLEALVLNFPDAKARTKAAITRTQTKTDFKCTFCDYVYKETAGLPEDNIPPGTHWKDLPETWTCPDCGSSKADFQMMESNN